MGTNTELRNTFSVLVVDDEEHVLSLVPAIFADMPVNILVAQDEEAGWQLFQNHRPRLVFLDLKLRSANGMNLLARIAEFDQGAEVILLSGEYSPALSDRGHSKRSCRVFAQARRGR